MITYLTSKDKIGIQPEKVIYTHDIHEYMEEIKKGGSTPKKAEEKKKTIYMDHIIDGHTRIICKESEVFEKINEVRGRFPYVRFEVK